MLYHSDSNHTILYHYGIKALVLEINNCYFHREAFFIYMNVNHSAKSGRRNKSITHFK